MIAFVFPCRGCSKVICNHCAEKYGIKINEFLGFNSEDDNEIRYMNEHSGEDFTFLCEECCATLVHY